ncbi:MAG: PhoH family protein [Lachnospiraceae bacterium]|nr:PhoH family protein [Lachnospiraceae bacterium]MDY2957189.1 PhoH family protein [Lachnospiraceae bacterium]
MGMIEASLDIPVETAEIVFGPLDRYIKKIEKTLQVTVLQRDSSVKIMGNNDTVSRAVHVIKALSSLASNKGELTEQDVDYCLSLSEDNNEEQIVEIDKDTVARTFLGKPIKPKTLGQKQYIDMIREKMIVFGIGPAGTGKTYLAMAMAVNAFKKNEVERIILTRPAIEAGEKLGFLPGDLQSKVDPYLRPLYDALFEIMGAESFNINLERGLIEVAPLAYMRGRTLDNAFIILDEAQNTTPSQMKMFLTRIGFGSKVIVTGDGSQKDLPPNIKSGLDEAVKILKDIPEIGFNRFSTRDVVRHPLVQRIVKAYEEHERREARKEEKK